MEIAEITTTCTICEREFTYERNEKTHDKYIRKLCNECGKIKRGKAGKHAAQHLVKRKTCDMVKNDIKILKAIHESNEQSASISDIQQMTQLSKETIKTHVRDLQELSFIDITKTGKYCLTLPGVLTVKCYEMTI